MLPSLKDVVSQYGLMANKALGQNFLLDSNITDKIIKLSLNQQNLIDFSSYNIIEIGPGPGGLTRSILEAKPKSLGVIEMDSRCLQIMEDIKKEYSCLMEIINADAMNFDIPSHFASPRQIISNLPYNISVPLLINWLQQIKEYFALTLMFQKEVAERITAKTCCKDYGRVSVIAQLTCKIQKLMDLNPACFTPAPKIWSTVLLFTPLSSAPSKGEIQKIEKITSLAFGQRRKMLRQSLKSIKEIGQKLEQIGIKETMRAEEVTPQQFFELSKLI